MAVKYEDLELAYDFVNSEPYGDHSALLNRSTGQIYWSSESGDLDEISEAMWESNDAVEIPRKEDLDLGNYKLGVGGSKENIELKWTQIKIDINESEMP